MSAHFMNTTLTREEKRIKIAEACGLDCSRISHKARWNGEAWEKIPDYFGDLNACAEMEKTMTDDQRFLFACMLGEIVLSTPEDPPNYELSDYGPGSWAGMKEVSRVISATAEQRAEAFGLTLGLW